MRFGGKILFKDVNLQLDPGHRYGLVGANGSGKSTLIRLITGELTSEGGEISRPAQLSIGSLKQDHFAYEDTPILSIVLQGRPRLWEAMQKKAELLGRAFDEKACDLLDQIETQFTESGGYGAESEAAKLLEGLGIKEELHRQNLSILSGGFKLRVLLAQLLFSKPDILLLDEPTNHLDMPSIKWLEGYLCQFGGTVLISSHDRIFINAVCTDIIDLDHQTLTVYKGNYDAFAAVKLAIQEQREAELSNQEKKKEHLQSFIDRFRAKSSKARQAQSKMHLVKKLEKEMSELDLPPSCRMYPKISFQQYRPSGAISLKVQNLCKAYGDKKVISALSFAVERGDRVCFVGPNGIGKSTLLNTLTARIAQDLGTFEWGHAVKVAYFPQDHKKEVNGEQTLLQWLTKECPSIPEQKLREVLAKVLFSGDQADKSTAILSGGETARLILAKMMLHEHNVLLFDEPTNHLDMEGTDALIEALQNYPGTLLIVSHNRYFISQIANRIIEMQPDGIKDIRGTYADYLAQADKDIFFTSLQEKTQETSDKRDYQQHKEKRKEEAKIKRQIALLEEECHKLEQAISVLDKQLASDNFYEKTPPEELKRLLKQKNDLESRLNLCLGEWERLGLFLQESN